MFYLGLQAAAWRLPFLPTRAGLGSDVLADQPGPAHRALALHRGPLRRPEPGAELVAMPALHLDAAVVHANRADTAGNAQFLGPDPFFDDLFLGAAERRFVTAERVVEPGELPAEGPLSAVHGQPAADRRRGRDPGRGPLHGRARPTTGATRPSRREYAASAADPEACAAFRARYLDVDEAGYQAAVRARPAA